MTEKKTLRQIMTAGLLLATFGISSCSQQEGGEGQGRLQVRLTDAPGDYEAVWIEVEDVLIKRTAEEGEENWESLPGVRTGHYNLLDLVNGKDTMLVDALIPSGTVRQLRLLLGEDNWITIDGEDIPLNTPSAQQSGLKLQLDADVNSGLVYSLILDFDVAKSIVKAGNSGKYNLKPVIRAFLDAQGGNLSGRIAPADVQAAILAIREGDTISTFPAEDGQFLFKALDPGSYSVHILPDTSTSYLPYDTAGVVVEEAQVTDLGTIELAE